MRIVIFEGSTSEYAAVQHLFGSKSNASETESQHATQASPVPNDPGSKPFVNAQQAERILSRLELSRRMLTILKTLYDAGGRRVNSEDLRRAAKTNANEFKGILGAFGRRIAHTSPGHLFFDQRWDSSSNQYTWTLPESVRIAIRQLKLFV